MHRWIITGLLAVTCVAASGCLVVTPRTARELWSRQRPTTAEDEGNDWSWADEAEVRGTADPVPESAAESAAPEPATATGSAAATQKASTKPESSGSPDVALARDAEDEKTEDEKKAKSSEDPARKLADQRRKLRGVDRKLELAQLELQDARQGGEVEIEGLEASVASAQRKLNVFVELRLPNRVEAANADLESAQNRYQDAVDELAQLEMMYKDSELEDKTSEIVLSRGRRQLALSRKRLDIQRRDRAVLVDHQLPEERRELEKKLTSARHALEAGRRKRHLTMVRKEMAIVDLRDSREELLRDIATLEKKVSGGTTASRGSR